MNKLGALDLVPAKHFDGNGNVAPENQENHLASILNTMKDRLGSAPGAAHDATTGQAPVTAGAGPVVAKVGELVLYDPTAASTAISAPADPKAGDSFGIKNVSTDATNGALVSPETGGQIEDPATPGVLGAVDAATAAIVGAGQVTRWQYVVTAAASGWWIV